MISCIAYGVGENDKYYVQTCCNEEHLGQACDCRSLGEDFTEDEAKALADVKAKELNLPIEIW